MTHSKAAREAALKMLEKIVERDEAYSAVNLAIDGLNQDSPTHVHMIDSELYVSLLTLIDAALGDEVGTYFLNECRSMPGWVGGITEKDGTHWRIQTVDDVRAYLNKAANS